MLQSSAEKGSQNMSVTLGIIWRAFLRGYLAYGAAATTGSRELVATKC